MTAHFAFRIRMTESDCRCSCWRACWSARSPVRCIEHDSEFKPGQPSCICSRNAWCGIAPWELAEANLALQNEIAQHKEIQATLEQREFLIAILQNIGDGVAACDATGAITIFNRQAETFAAVGRPDRFPSRNAHHRFGFYRPDGVTLLTAEELPLHRAWLGESHRDTELAIRSAAGDLRAILACGQPLINAAGEKLGAVVVMQDVTEKKQALEQIRDLNAKLELRLQRLGVLRRIDMAINASLDIHATLATFVELISPQLEVDAMAILLMDPSTHRLEYASGRGFRGNIDHRSSLCLDEGLAGCASLDHRLFRGSPAETVG